MQYTQNIMRALAVTDIQIKEIVKKLSNTTMLYTFLIIAFGFGLQKFIDNPIAPAIWFCAGVILTLMVTLHLIQITLVEISKFEQSKVE